MNTGDSADHHRFADRPDGLDQEGFRYVWGVLNEIEMFHQL